MVAGEQPAKVTESAGATKAVSGDEAKAIGRLLLDVNKAEREGVYNPRITAEAQLKLVTAGILPPGQQFMGVSSNGTGIVTMDTTLKDHGKLNTYEFKTTGGETKLEKIEVPHDCPTASATVTEAEIIAAKRQAARILQERNPDIDLTNLSRCQEIDCNQLVQFLIKENQRQARWLTAGKISEGHLSAEPTAVALGNNWGLQGFADWGDKLLGAHETNRTLHPPGTSWNDEAGYDRVAYYDAGYPKETPPDATTGERTISASGYVNDAGGFYGLVGYRTHFDDTTTRDRDNRITHQHMHYEYHHYENIKMKGRPEYR